jgi:hypothetical protein
VVVGRDRGPQDCDERDDVRGVVEGPQFLVEDLDACSHPRGEPPRARWGRVDTPLMSPSLEMVSISAVKVKTSGLNPLLIIVTYRPSASTLALDRWHMVIKVL